MPIWLKKITMKKLIVFGLVWLMISCQTKNQEEIKNQKLGLQINEKMQTQLLISKQILSPWNNSDLILINGENFSDFYLQSSTSKTISDQIGSGTEYEFVGESQQIPGLLKKLQIKSYHDFPDMLLSKTSYINQSNQELKVDGWISQNYQIEEDKNDSLFWSFQGSSSEERADWILPVRQGFYKENYMGMNNSDYGGGIPVLDIWRRDAGVAIGHVSMTPELVSFPLDFKGNNEFANISLQKHFDESLLLKAGDSISTIESFVMVHENDCFEPLAEFSNLMRKKGLKFAPIEDQAFEPIWCAWGYERGFTLDEIIGTLPKVKELGFKWVVLDDGFQIAEGDWMVNKDKFPKGEQQMKDFVKTIHSYGLKAKLWWAPLAVDSTAELLVNHPDILLLNKDGSPQEITWWDSWYMSPIAEETKEHTRQTVQMFLRDWDFDGLKMDGQHMNAVPPDYNPARKNANPEDAVHKLPLFFKDVYETARAIKPNAVIENCPCGDCMSFYNMPYINQSVSSDPTSSWQIRTKGKVYKALMGKAAYYGDHVELSDGGNDFASSFGVGAVLGSKFTWPKDHPNASGVFVLTPEKEAIWKKWISLYNDKMLSKGNYLGTLYDIGFDKPETHLIQKGDTLFYAFYANHWSGEIELKGLDSSKNYQVRDYFNEKDLGEISGNHPMLQTDFDRFLFIEVY